jgi:hypothetical protein
MDRIVVWTNRTPGLTRSRYECRTASGGLNPGELPGVGADEVRLDCRFAVVGQQVLQLCPRVKRVLVHVPDELPGRVPALSA